MAPTPHERAATLERTSRLVRSMAQEFDRVAAECLQGMTIAQWHVLAALDGGAGRPMAALGAATSLPGPSLTRLIDGMVDDNLVIRKSDITDRRRILVFPTRRGTDLYQSVCEQLAVSERVADLLAATSSLVETLPGLLDRVRSAEQPAATNR